MGLHGGGAVAFNLFRERIVRHYKAEMLTKSQNIVVDQK